MSKVRKIEHLAKSIKNQGDLDGALASVASIADRAQIFKIMRPFLSFQATFYVEPELKN